jgi:multidrug efflux pump subunit AcrB
LFASLFVAYVFNPVFAVSFMKHEYDQEFQQGNTWRKLKISTIVMGALAVLLYVVYFVGNSNGAFTMANLLAFAVILILLFHFVLKRAIHTFQEKTWPSIMVFYERQLRWVLKGARPVWILVGMIGLFFATIFITGVAKPTVLFFPDGDPNSVYVYIKMPGGTHQNVTDSVTRVVEKRVYAALGQSNPDVESIISNVTIGAE